LLVTHSLLRGGPAIDSLEALRNTIRLHWHRGALELWRDFNECEQNYDKFLETLVERRSQMPETATPQDDGVVTEPGKPGAAQDQSAALAKALGELGIQVQIKDARHGPRLTRYRVVLMNLADSSKIDRGLSQLALALNLGQKLPAKSNGDVARTVFIDLPRPRESWTTVQFDKLKDWAARSVRDTTKLLVYAGVSVTGEDVVMDLATAPHLFVGGTTNSGKSVCLHSLIASMLLKHSPDTLQLALIDPKRVEFSRYAKLPNLYRGGIATETPQAREMLQELVVEMDARYASFERIGVANIADARKQGQQLYFIVAVIEEMSALVHGDKNIQPLIERLAEKARAAGIHLVLATQRPDAETFTGLLRSNIPARIALSVQKGTESKIILDEIGAENLLGAGDMLLKLPGEPLRRAHGVFLKPEQVVAATAKKS
jgi:S-DNA-T family DNA segregation ATPase FtsK/SpoIIIE